MVLELYDSLAAFGTGYLPFREGRRRSPPRPAFQLGRIDFYGILQHVHVVSRHVSKHVIVPVRVVSGIPDHDGVPVRFYPPDCGEG